MAERAAAQDDPDRERAQRDVALREPADAGSGADEQCYVNGAAGAVRPPPEPLERGGGAPARRDRAGGAGARGAGWRAEAGGGAGGAGGARALWRPAEERRENRAARECPVGRQAEHGTPRDDVERGLETAVSDLVALE